MVSIQVLHRVALSGDQDGLGGKIEVYSTSNLRL